MDERLSLEQPRIVISFSRNEHGFGWTYDNVGLGVARIRGFKLLIDGKPQPANNVNDIIDIIENTLYLGASRDVDFHDGSVGAILKPGAHGALIWLHGGPGSKQRLDSTQRINFETCYCSFYNECWISSSVVSMQSTDRQDNNCSTFAGKRYSWW